MKIRFARYLAPAVLAMLLAAGCSGTDSRSSQEVVVSAASSLTDVFRDMTVAFEEAHPDLDVLLNLGGSAALREQVLEGAPVDVFASANTETMNDVMGAGDVAESPVVFAINHMVIAVPAGNPSNVAGLDDFARTELFIGLCAESVPCGAFAREVLSSAMVNASVDTNEPDVRSLLFKIGLGEIDAGIVYATDAISAEGDVDVIAIPAEHDVDAEYPIALLAGAPNPSAGSEFIAFVTSEAGVAILQDHGFGLP